ncbi:flagellar basal-body rod protein FlgG [Plasticicumulans acidivorans]|uniref:Flagellar basal-body rod protein FlgG n=1 Tax=Plasticicumulans acidivorans TaxID=886464 RepID=A0A317MXR5_9GAMM|nr:flagellar basal-body rod protein FlgG [Plasticicumulans acidivorans]PWV63318.1 flagellar basal-body rod protein FlgG [Plasticicumulans acidivorans]
MNPALWVAKTGLDAQQTQLDVVANNLANVNTTGFKKGRAKFEDLLYQNVRQVGGQTSQNTTLPSGLMLGTGVRVVATEKLHTQGNAINTGNALDVAINGRGFFQVELPDGTIAYTRDGSFTLNDQGQLVTSEGYLVSPQLTVPSDMQSISIGSDGVVSVVQPGQTGSQQLGNLTIADFVNPTGLQPIGDNLYLESSSSGTAQTGDPGTNGLGTLQQHMLESSNVNIAEELVNMIETQRAYEVNSKAIQTADQMLQYLNQTI